MSTTTRLTFADYERLPEKEGTRYELDEGTLLMEPSPLSSQPDPSKDCRAVDSVCACSSLGVVVEEMDFRLDTDTVRNPDVAFISADYLRNIDPDHSPVEGAPAFAIEVISPTNLAQDTAKKVRQYLEAGSVAVWLVYPALRFIEVHDSAGARRIMEPESIRNPKFLADSISLFLWQRFSMIYSNSDPFLQPISSFDYYFTPCPFNGFPAIAPVAFPFSNATCPFTITYFTPSASWAG